MRRKYGSSLTVAMPRRSIQPLFLLALVALAGWVHASQEGIQRIEVKLGDYKFEPRQIQLKADQRVLLQLVNIDRVVPHNFTLALPDENATVDVDVAAGETIEVELGPLNAGRYPFYCGKKMIFMKSHREKGMEGVMIVEPE